MPWSTIIIMVIAYILSKKSGADDTEAALITAGAGAAAYYTVEPTNEDAIWGDTTRDLFGMKTPDAGTIPTTGATTPVTTPTGAITESVNPENSGGIIDNVADVLTSWGAVGTAGVIATAGATTSNNTNKWILLGGAALLLLAFMD